MLGAAGLALTGVAASAASPKSAPKSSAPEDVLNEAAVLRDTAVPVGGNPDGDISLVEWFDYQCPYCRKLAPDLATLVSADGKLRMVFKDWPILGPELKTAARLVLASRSQDKYLAAHKALIGVSGRLTDSNIRETLAAAGVDVARAERDAKSDDIKRILARNDEQAKAFGFQGTPSFIIGKFRVPGVLTVEQFKMAIADARKAAGVTPVPGEKI